MMGLQQRLTYARPENCSVFVVLRKKIGLKWETKSREREICEAEEVPTRPPLDV